VPTGFLPCPGKNFDSVNAKKPSSVFAWGGRIREGLEPFLAFQGSRAGLFYGLSARETCLLRRSPRIHSGPGLPPTDKS
jgi:hypothetical protein